MINSDTGIDPSCTTNPNEFNEKSFGTRLAFPENVRKVKKMQQMIEFYEMVSMNDAALRGSEKMAILKARLALQMFERAMQTFKAETTPAQVVAMKAAA